MIDTKNVDWDDFQLAKSGRSVKVLYKKMPVKFCSSALYTPFGVKSVNKEWSAFTEYSLDCSLNQSNSEGSVAFRDFLHKLDEKIQDLVKTNNSILNVVDFQYTPILRENGSYPKLMKLQVVRDKNGNFASFMFDNNKEKIKVGENNIDEVLGKGKIFKCIVECAKVWSYNGKVGTIWNIEQLKFEERPVTNTQTNVYSDDLFID
jgi:hypothetical protein